MKKRQLAEDIRGSLSMSAGWLFADLLLVLAMLFLAANTMGIHPPPTTPKATPTPTIKPQLEQGYHRFHVVVNTQALLSNDSKAINSVIQQVTGQPFLKGRSAGLIIAYGGAPDDSGIANAERIAEKVYSIVLGLGAPSSKYYSIFSNIRKYDPLYILGGDINTIAIDIFLFSQSSP
jgi:hypothetical protein